MRLRPETAADPQAQDLDPLRIHLALGEALLDSLSRLSRSYRTLCQLPQQTNQPPPTPQPTLQRWKRRYQGLIIVSGRVDAGTHRPMGDLSEIEVTNDLPHGLPVGQVRIKPRRKTFGIQSQWHAVMDLLGHTSCRFS